MSAVVRYRTRVRQWSLRTKAAAVLLPLLLSFSATGVALVRAQAAVVAATNDVLHITEVRRDAAEALRLMTEAESALHGYLVDGDTLFQGRLDAVAPQVVPLLQRSSQVSQDPEAQRRLALAVELARSEIAHLRSLRRNGSRLPRPALLASLQSSHQRMNAFRTVLSDFDDRERRLLDARLGVVHDTRARQTWALSATLGIGLLAGCVGAVLLVGRTVRRLRVMTEERAAGAAAEGDEIDRLQAAIESAEEVSRRSAQAAQRARDTFQRLLSASPVVALEGPVGGSAFTWVSDNCGRVFGWPQEQLVDSPAWWDRLVGKACAVGHPAEDAPGSHHEDLLLDAQGRQRHVLVTSVHDGQHITVYLLDLTAQRAAEAASASAARTVEDLLAAAPDIVSLLDAEGRIERSTMAARLPPRVPAVDVVGSDPVQLAIEEDRPPMREAIRLLLAGERQALKRRHRVRTPSGRIAWQESYARRMENVDGSVRGLAVVTRDVTAQVEQEAELQRARQAAEEANHAKTEFLSRMSHELRTPLNAILGFTQLLERSALDDDDRESVEHVLRAGRHLLNLINDVLDISQVESGNAQMSMEPVQVAAVARSASALVSPLAADRCVDLVLEGEEDCLVLGDHQRLTQVLINLLSNGVKYNQRGGTVRATWHRVAEGRVEVAVADDGPGIAPELLDRVFVPFDRLGAEATDVEGTGVGLPLCKQLVEAMHGSLRVDSVLRQGTTFTVALSEGSSAPQPSSLIPQPSPAPAAEVLPSTVLYVEDNPVNIALVRKMLRERPEVRLVSALRGDRGLTMAQELLPDLVLLDQHLPGLPGSEVLAALKADPRTAAVPVVVISAEAHGSSIDAMRAAGALQYLTKPIDMDELLAVVDAALAHELEATR